MLVLLSLSVMALALVGLKLYQFGRSGLGNFPKVSEALRLLRTKPLEATLCELKTINSPASRVIEAALESIIKTEMTQEDVEAEISRVANAELRNLEAWLRPLGAIAHLAPLLGLLGTVLGMIEAFQKIGGSNGQPSPALLAGGIWEALLTTAFGLIVAIPSMAAYYYLEGIVDDVRAKIKDSSSRLLIRFEHLLELKKATKLFRSNASSDSSSAETESLKKAH